MAVISLVSLMPSCSINYDEQVSSRENTPEFIFKQADFRRYENTKKSMELQAKRLEQYNNNKLSYALEAFFQTWNDKQEPDTDGTCQILCIDQSSKLYTLYNNICIKNHSQNATITADDLKFNGNNEQLTSNINSTVTITKDGITVSGTGFSASGVSRSYAFYGQTVGTINTDDLEDSDQSTDPTESSQKEAQ